MDKSLGVHSLTWKMILVLLTAAVVALILALSTLVLGRYMVNTHYSSPKIVQQRLDWEMEQFQTYVWENNILSTDMAGVEAWNLAHEDVGMSIYADADSVLISDRLGTSRLTLTGQLLEQAGFREDGRKSYSIAFADGTFQVDAYEYPQERLYFAVDLSAVVVAAVAFLTISLLYMHRMTVSIQRIGRQVRQVSRGQLETAIVPSSRDEIGQLARDVDTMRLSIIDQLQSEEMAWQANGQLITALSHDLRTPLTAILGYLDILSDENLPPQQRQEYLQVCTKQAQRLKDLSNELLGFFMVYGGRKPEQTMETLDANVLLDQILGEQLEVLRSQGYDVRHVVAQQLEGTITVDVGHLRRVFDKLFSNAVKYARMDMPVTLLETVEEGKLCVCMTNYIPISSPRVESTKIGLQTCRKLMEAMGGGFTVSRDGDRFTAQVILPLEDT